MKNLIIVTLNEAHDNILKKVPQTKKETVYVNIEDVKPLDLANFMKTNNIPDNAYFNGKPNGYDSFDIICLSYEIDVPTTDKDKFKFVKTQFNNVFGKVNKALTENGYKRQGYNSGLLKQFDDSTVYDMYMNKEFDRLVSYYSLSFSLS